MHSTIQEILVSKLPRLGELTFGCRIRDKNGLSDGMDGAEYATILWKEVFKKLDFTSTQYAIRYDDYSRTTFMPVDDLNFEILGHPFTHADILEALGEDWAMTGDYQLLFFPRGHTSMVFGMDMGPQWIEKGITLPRVLSNLSLPEYEETRKQLIQLLTK